MYPTIYVPTLSPPIMFPKTTNIHSLKNPHSYHPFLLTFPSSPHTLWLLRPSHLSILSFFPFRFHFSFDDPFPSSLHSHSTFLPFFPFLFNTLPIPVSPNSSRLSPICTPLPLRPAFPPTRPLHLLSYPSPTPLPYLNFPFTFLSDSSRSILCPTVLIPLTFIHRSPRSPTHPPTAPSFRASGFLLFFVPFSVFSFNNLYAQ